MVDRLKISQDNTRNHLKRRRLLWEAWDQLFQILHASTKRLAPLLHTMMWESCNLRAMGVVGGHFDGPLAWRILLSRINATERTKADKLYYDSCLGIQKANRLSDGCTADAFSKRAIAFVLHLMPNLAQKYTQEDAADYIVELMPPSLREAGKRVTYNCKQDGTYLDLMKLIKLCESEVFDLQKTSTNKPQLTMLAGAVVQDDVAYDPNGFKLDAMSETCGMCLGAGRGHAAFAGFGTPSGEKPIKWCPQCPHPRDLVCFTNPGYVGPPPPSVWEDKPKWKGLMAARDANAKAQGVTAPRVAGPSKESIEKFKEVKARRDEARKKGGDKRRGEKRDTTATPGGVAAPGSASSDTVDDFFAGLVDLSNIALVSVEADVAVEQWDPTAWYVVSGAGVESAVTRIADTLERDRLLALGCTLDGYSSRDDADAALEEAMLEGNMPVMHWFVVVPSAAGTAPVELCAPLTPIHLHAQSAMCTSSATTARWRELSSRTTAGSSTTPPMTPTPTMTPSPHRATLLRQTTTQTSAGADRSTVDAGTPATLVAEVPRQPLFTPSVSRPMTLTEQQAARHMQTVGARTPSALLFGAPPSEARRQCPPTRYVVRERTVPTPAHPSPTIPTYIRRDRGRRLCVWGGLFQRDLRLDTVALSHTH